MGFNQPLLLPPFIQALGPAASGEGSKRRNLLSIEEIDPLEFVDIQVKKKDPDFRPSQSQFSAQLKKWTEDEIVMKLDFKSPLAMSQGAFNDQIKVRIKTPQYFASKQTGLILESGDLDV